MSSRAAVASADDLSSNDIPDIKITPFGPEFVDPPKDEAAVERRLLELSKLTSIKYQLARAEASKELGISLGALDPLVRRMREPEDSGQGRPISFLPIEIWPGPVDLGELLDEIVGALRKYIILTPVQADAVALWATFTHAFDLFDVSPRLVVKSPQKRSGKSKLFATLARLVARPRGASGITASALLRMIELHHPTMLIDEMDALMRAGEEMAQALRGLMNAGFDRAFATFTMNVKTADGGYEPREFSCWAPLALAGIGDLPDTIRDRAIEIDMKRKLPTETVKKLRRRHGEDLNALARKLARWMFDKPESLRTAEPAMPDGLNDRAADAWEPLLAIADLAGGRWPARGRAAALLLSGDEVALAKDNDIGTMLLADIRDAFDSVGTEELTSERLTAILVTLEDRPWPEWKGGLTKNKLSRKLKDYEVISQQIKEFNAKGYHRRDFEDAFSRYLPVQGVSKRNFETRLEKPGVSEDLQNETKQAGFEFKNPGNPSKSGAGFEVSFSNPPSERKGVLEAKQGPSGKPRRVL